MARTNLLFHCAFPFPQVLPLGGDSCPPISCLPGDSPAPSPPASLLENLSWRVGPLKHQVLEGGLNASLLSSRVKSSQTLKSKLSLQPSTRTLPPHTHTHH